jgi:hypothetical protein
MAAAAAGNDDTPTPYLVMGHGVEDMGKNENEGNNFGSSRFRLPKGITVVTLALCGNSTFQEEVCPFLKLFTEGGVREMLTDPVHHIPELEARIDGKPVHVYTEGDMFPAFAVSYFARFSDMIYKSGIYRYPIRTKGLVPKAKQATDAVCPEFAVDAHTTLSDKVDTDVLEEVYKQSVYPPLPEIDPAKPITYKTFNNRMTLEFKDVFEALPKPAVYYYIICRAPYTRSKRTVFGKDPHIFSESMPGAYDVKITKRLLRLDEKYMKEEAEKIERGENARDFSGLEFVTHLKEHPEDAPESLHTLFERIKPTQTQNTLEAFRQVRDGVTELKAYDAELIKNKELRDKFKEFLRDFSGWQYEDPSSYIRRIEKRRRGSLAQQEKYKKGAAAAAAGHEGGARRRRHTRKGGKRGRKMTQRK